MNHYGIISFLVVLALAALPGCTSAPPGEAESQLARTSDPGAVIGKHWRWVSTVTPVETIDVADPDRYRFRLTPEGRAEVLFDCNRGGGDYSIDTGRLEFGRMMSTRMACPPDSMDSVFMRQLEAVRIFFIEDGDLYLDLFADSGTMRFEVADAD